MSTRATIIVVVLLVVLATLVGVAAYPRLPQQVASHWNTQNQVNGYLSRFWGAFLMPILAVGMFLLFLLIPAIDPLKANVAKFRGTFNAFIALVIAFVVYMQFLTLIWNLGYHFNMGAAMLPALGLLFIFAGVLIGKAKRNWFIGIRTPWTLSSDKVWDETHHLGAKLFIGSGILTLVGAFFERYALWFILVPVLESAVFLVVYSYLLYRHETQTQ
jgi:uncharacterized membrane protein